MENNTSNPIVASFVDNFSTAATSQTVLNTTSIGELQEQGLFTQVAPVSKSNTEGQYKGVLFVNAAGERQFIMFGRKSADKVQVGDKPRKSWQIAIVENEAGEQRLRIVVGNGGLIDIADLED